MFPTTIIMRRLADEYQGQFSMRDMQSNIFIQFLEILNSFLVPYILVIFLKKEFFLKKYFTEFTKIFFIVFASSKLLTIIMTLLSQTLPPEIYFSNAMQQAGGFMLELIIFYIAVCFIDKVDKENVLKQSSHTPQPTPATPAEV